tara:strand:+ start:335 stop:544 length:210 start_codon:yes stop_codon:yes gene_type:complete
MSKEELNKEWIKLSQEMQLLESKRREVYEAWGKEYGAIDLKTYTTPSIYADLRRVNIPTQEPSRGEAAI